MSDRIAIMRDGLVVQCDAPEALYRNPASRFVAEFLGEANLIDVTIGADGSVRGPGGAALPSTVAAGRGAGRATLLFRPEQVSIAPGDDGGPLASGIVRARDFLGDQYRVILQVEGLEAPVVVKQAAGQAVETLRPGATAQVTWHWQSCVLLDD